MVPRLWFALVSVWSAWSSRQRVDRNNLRGALSDGLCHYGNSVECCWGWSLEHGRCQPHCPHECKHGVCVSPGRCRCEPGFTGKTCNRDLNECGLKPRPCKHRCMNTVGSYKCYCADGFRLQPDGSCKNARTCFHTNCQYGCEVTKGRVQCTCPSPGLRLGPDQRSCVDINECVTVPGICPHRRKCLNTFGSFVCTCHFGSRLSYVNGRYSCIDKDTRSFCSLNPEAPKCKCKDGSCKDLPKVKVEPQTPRLTTATTPTTTTTTSATTTMLLDTTATSTTVNNHIHREVTHRQRGDVHIPRHPGHSQVWEFDIELGNTADDAKDDTDAVAIECTFDWGLCSWISDREGDLHWETSHGPRGERYLSVPPLKPGQRSLRGARLSIAVSPTLSLGPACFSFSHWLTGHHVGVVQLFLRSGWDQRYGSAVWSRTGGHGWRQTQVTLDKNSVDRILVKAERRRGHRSQIAVDDVKLRRGPCR
ncbi:unnamed protein product [Knipowitschia caucasica]|uniref:Nephronectin n=1 Tax=Knipowitschia caucasica TaxID=637954 RepID=A0AAV2KPJ8_KNICA